jgi:hypothetical protein
MFADLRQLYELNHSLAAGAPNAWPLQTHTPVCRCAYYSDLDVPLCTVRSPRLGALAKAPSPSASLLSIER